MESSCESGGISWEAEIRTHSVLTRNGVPWRSDLSHDRRLRMRLSFRFQHIQSNKHHSNGRHTKWRLRTDLTEAQGHSNSPSLKFFIFQMEPVIATSFVRLWRFKGEMLVFIEKEVGVKLFRCETHGRLTLWKGSWLSQVSRTQCTSSSDPGLVGCYVRHHCVKL